nr:serine/threonine-protein kinase [Acanthopleuribacter pedis]
MAEGILDATEADALKEQAHALERSPLALLEERGVLSPQTRQRLAGDGQTVSSTQRPNDGAFGGLSQAGGDFPLTHWDRYQPEHFLGQGGMGRVFLAWDAQLQRKVAIKFLRHNRQKDAKRLIREARAQARIQHDRVCKVYEVHEEEGQVFITMEFIEGAPLSQRRVEWTLDTYIYLIRDIAHGLHAAHDAGLIHRDIKPSNIMVRTPGGGGPKAVLMDFGLAMAWTEEDTLAWSAGTPSFMSPEQALGQEGCLDPRSDVYSLGATLYWCLCNRPPIMGKNSLDTISMIPHADPPDPQSLNPEISRDLAMIIKKCLRKDRADRYPSAKAFAEDLAALQAGDAVSVRGSDWWYLTRKKLRQNKLAVMATAALLMMATTLGLNTWHLNVQAAQREEWARNFSEAAEEIEATMRFSHMLPPHDIRAEMGELRQRIAAMKTMRDNAGPPAFDAADFAIGRAYAAFDEHETALTFLERAWNNGYRLPAVAYALAQSRGELYNEARLGADNITDEQQRNRVLEQLYHQHALPARTLLENVPPSSTRFPAFLEAQMTWFDKEPRKALEILRRNAFQPWFYENFELQGALYANLAKQLRYVGEQDDADECFQKALYNLQKAIDIAPSSVDNYLTLAKLMSGEYYYHNIKPGSHRHYLDKALSYTETALRINPDHPAALVFKANLKGLSFIDEVNKGTVNLDELGQEIHTLEKLTRAGYDKEHILAALMRLLCIRAQQETNTNNSAREDLEHIWELSKKIAVSERTDNYYQILGQAHQIASKGPALSEEHRLRHIESAAAAYEEAIKLSPSAQRIRMSLGLVYLEKANLWSEDQKGAILDQVITTFNDFLSRDDNNMFVHYYLGQSMRKRDLLERTTSYSDFTLLEQALCHYQKAEEIRPTVPNFAQSQGMMLSRMALRKLNMGLDCSDTLHQAEKALQRAIDTNPKYHNSYDSYLIVEARKIRLAAATGRGSSGFIENCQKLRDKAKKHRPSNAFNDYHFAQAHYYHALSLLKQHKPFRHHLRHAEEIVQNLLNHDPNDRLNLCLLSDVSFLEGIVRFTQGKLRPDFLASIDQLHAQITADPVLWPEPQRNELRRAYLHALAHLGSSEETRFMKAFDQTATRFQRLYPTMIEARVLSGELQVWRALSANRQKAAKTAFQKLGALKNQYPAAQIYSLDLKRPLEQQAVYSQF